MKALPGLVLALLVTIAGASACSDSTSTRTGGQGGSGAGETSDAGEGPLTSAGTSMGEGGGSTTEGGSAAEPVGGSEATAGAGGAGETALPTASGYCEGFAEALCAWRVACHQLDDCMIWGGYLSFVQECSDARASEAGGFVTFVPEAAVECLAAVEAASSDCNGGPPFIATAVQVACRDVFDGTVAEGDECSRADFASVFDECDNAYCDRSPGECLGSCVGYQQEDEDCSLGQVCEPGLFCNDSSCVPPVGLGEDCSGATCELGLSCAGQPLTCRDRGPVGSACVDQFDCEYPAGCSDDECALELDIGDPCQSSEACQADLYCNLNGQPGPVCAARIAAAAACEPNGDSCVLGYQCSEVEPHVCVELQGGLNEPCGPLAGC